MKIFQTRGENEIIVPACTCKSPKIDNKGCLYNYVKIDEISMKSKMIPHYFGASTKSCQDNLKTLQVWCP